MGGLPKAARPGFEDAPEFFFVAARFQEGVTLSPRVKRIEEESQRDMGRLRGLCLCPHGR